MPHAKPYKEIATQAVCGTDSREEQFHKVAWNVWGKILWIVVPAVWCLQVSRITAGAVPLEEGRVCSRDGGGSRVCQGHGHRRAPACRDSCSLHFSTGAPEQLAPCRKLFSTSLALVCRHFWCVIFGRVLAEGRFLYVVHRITLLCTSLVFELWSEQFSWSLCFLDNLSP